MSYIITQQNLEAKDQLPQSSNDRTTLIITIEHNKTRFPLFTY